jgi:hypothetical protein
VQLKFSLGYKTSAVTKKVNGDNPFPKPFWKRYACFVNKRQARASTGSE